MSPAEVFTPKLGKPPFMIKEGQEIRATLGYKNRRISLDAMVDLGPYTLCGTKDGYKIVANPAFINFGSAEVSVKRVFSLRRGIHDEVTVEKSPNSEGFDNINPETGILELSDGTVIVPISKHDYKRMKNWWNDGEEEWIYDN